MSTLLHFWKKNKRRNLWQHPDWEAFQKSIGRTTKWIQVEGAQALVVTHQMPLGLTWIEVPRGPLFEDVESLERIMSEIEKYGKKEKAVFVRLSPFKNLTAHRSPLTATKYDHQPQTSLVIDLEQTEEDILRQMKPKGRYNIKVAQKHGVSIASMENVDDFYELLNVTGSRDGFGIHPKRYYQKMIDKMPKNAKLLLALHHNKVIAGGLFIYLDDWGIYYYGASDNHHRNVMAPYLIQWEAMREAKRRGCKRYDFLGIAPEGAQNHPWKGVTDFKKKFGGTVKNYPIAQDMVLRLFWYAVYQMYKKFR